MEKKYETLNDVTNIFRLSALILSCAVLIFYYMHMDFDWILFLWVPLFLFLCYLSLLKIHRLVLFLPVQLVLSTLAFCIPNQMISRIFCLIIIIMMLCINLHFWFAESEQRVVIPSQELVFVFVALSAYPAWHKDTSACMKIYFLGVLFFILGYLTKYLTHTAHIPVQSKDHGYAPAETIQLSSMKAINKVLLSFFIVSFLSFLPDCYTYIQHMIQFIKDLLWRLLNKQNSEPTPTTSKPEAPQNSHKIDLDTLFPEKETNPMIKKAIEMILLIAVIIITCFLLYQLVKNLIKLLRLWLFKPTKQPLLKNDFTPTEVKEHLNTKSKKRPTLPLFLTQTNNTLVRKRYHSTIKSLQKKGYDVTLSHTPKEREADLIKKQQENIEELTVLYNKARYSQYNIEKTELTKLRKNK